MSLNLYLELLGQEIQSLRVWCHGYAYDTFNYISPSHLIPTKLFCALCLLSVMDWMRANKPKINSDKTEALLVHHKQTRE